MHFSTDVGMRSFRFPRAGLVSRVYAFLFRPDADGIVSD